MSNLPPGVTSADIDRATGGDELAEHDREREECEWDEAESKADIRRENQLRG